MERHCDHWFDLAKVDFHAAIIVSSFAWFQFFVIFASSMNLIEFLNLLICLPDRGKTGSLCCHYIHTDTEIST